jgi:glyoxylase-like metal-dependent hydrolase (beta-lactamase superfamily II)/rhodanese-related sulfurtransferase
MPAMELQPFATAGLGDTSYLLASDGEAILVDPQRDAWRFLEAAEARGWRITHVLETHVHNDYVSGALETRAATGAEIVAPARGAYQFKVRAADEGDTLEVGALRITAIATPGHTPEHLSYAVEPLDGGAGSDDAASATTPTAIFSGGSLLVGSVGRTDLLGLALMPALTADQQRTLRRFAALPDDVAILPTHGAGSFCSAGPATGKWYTTIGTERQANPVFGAAGMPEGAFRELLLAGLRRYPAYYAHMARINRAGPRTLGRLPLPDPMDPARFAAAAAAGATIVDGRDRTAHASTHISGSLNIELDESFASYVGWLVPFDAPLLLVLPEPAAETLPDAVVQLLRIGYERVGGWLEGGLERWAESGRPTSGYAVVAIRDAAGEPGPAGASTILDVRQPIEWRTEGVIDGSRTIFVADLAGRLDELPRDRPVTVLCKSGSRASMAASLLDGAGFDVRLVAQGGAPSWPEPLVPVEADADRGAAAT